MLRMLPGHGAPLDPNRLAAHADVMFRAAWALCGSRHDAEDLVQETFANVLARPRRIRESELGYLMRALRNTHADRHRAASRRPLTVELLDTDAPHHESRIDPRPIMEAIASAPPAFRDAVVAIDVLGLSYAEAARHLKVPEATVTTRLYRGRRHVARTLVDDPETPPGRSRSSGRLALTRGRPTGVSSPWPCGDTGTCESST